MISLRPISHPSPKGGSDARGAATRFPAPPAAAVADALEKLPGVEPIDQLHAGDLCGGARDDIDLRVYRHSDRPLSAKSDVPLRYPLRLWASDMAGLFRFFPLTMFNVVIRSPSRRLEDWTPRRPVVDLDSGTLWVAHRAFERDLAVHLTRDYGDTGFDLVDLVVRTGSQSRIASSQSGIEAMRDWLGDIDGESPSRSPAAH